MQRGAQRELAADANASKARVRSHVPVALHHLQHTHGRITLEKCNANADRLHLSEGRSEKSAKVISRFVHKWHKHVLIT